MDIAVWTDKDPAAGMFRELAEYLNGTDGVGDNDNDHCGMPRAKHLHVLGLLHFFVLAVRISFHYFADDDDDVVDRLDGYN